MELVDIYKYTDITSNYIQYVLKSLGELLLVSFYLFWCGGLFVKLRSVWTKSLTGLGNGVQKVHLAHINCMSVP